MVGKSTNKTASPAMQTNAPPSRTKSISPTSFTLNSLRQISYKIIAKNTRKSLRCALQHFPLRYSLDAGFPSQFSGPFLIPYCTSHAQVFLYKTPIPPWHAGIQPSLPEFHSATIPNGSVPRAIQFLASDLERGNKFRLDHFVSPDLF